MTLAEAYNFFERLKNEATKKTEIKIYTKFLHTLKELNIREFSTDEIQSIEAELDRLNLGSNPTNNKKYYTKTLTAFTNYLKEQHSLTSVGYYTNMGVSMGAAFGVVAGVIFGERFEKSMGLALGISLGMMIGIVIGRHMDSKALAEGKVY